MKDDEVRKLLAGFYDGSLSDEGGKKLADYFSGVGYDSLPEDLKSSYRLFEGYASIRKEKSTVTAHRRPVFPLYGYALACVVAGLILTIGLRMLPKTNYGYDFDGKSIVSAEAALEEMKNLGLLALLRENEQTAYELFNY